MPGFEIDALGARRFIKQTLEWTLPPYVFETFGTPSLHATWLRPALFATALWTDADDGSAKRKLGSVGTKLDLRISTLHWYEMILSVGYARGFERGQRARNEWMVSLKLL